MLKTQPFPHFCSKITKQNFAKLIINISPFLWNFLRKVINCLIKYKNQHTNLVDTFSHLKNIFCCILLQFFFKWEICCWYWSVIVLHALYSMYCILWIVLYAMHCILCIVLYALYSMHYILCIVLYALNSMHCTLCIVFFALYYMHFIHCIIKSNYWTLKLVAERPNDGHCHI